MTVDPQPSNRRTRRGALIWRVATVAVAVIGLGCLAFERGQMSGTFDESNHLAAGLEWWQFGTYTMWTENPPLPRLAIGAVPYLAGMRLPPRTEWEPKTHDWDRSWQVGLELLYGGDGFETNLGRARLGTMPFFVLALLAAWGLAGGRRRPLAGFVAVALTATFPALVAHGALATTDVAFAGTFLLAALTLARWFEAATVARALALGGALGLALLCKFSVLAFFPVMVVAFLAARLIARLPARPVPHGGPLRWGGARGVAAQAGCAAAATVLVVWAGYRFSVGRMDALAPEVKGWLHLLPPVAERRGLTGWFIHAVLPMPELFHGLRFLLAHDAAGHEAYLLGQVAERGFLAFYPVALAVKTPLPFLVLVVAALPWLRRRRPDLWPAQALVLAALGIVLVSMRSHVNLGIRHVFVVMPLLGIATARILDGLLASGVPAQLLPFGDRARAVATAAVVVLVAVQAAGLIAVRGRALASFNVFAGADPATVLLDSDLDWGQDLFALRREVRARGVDRLTLGFFGMGRLCRHDLPPLAGLVPGRPATGWIAISENYFRHRSTFMLLKDPCDPTSTYRDSEVPPAPFAWLRAHTPVAVAGSSIRLYHIPPP